MWSLSGKCLHSGELDLKGSFSSRLLSLRKLGESGQGYAPHKKSAPEFQNTSFTFVLCIHAIHSVIDKFCIKKQIGNEGAGSVMGADAELQRRGMRGFSCLLPGLFP